MKHFSCTISLLVLSSAASAQSLDRATDNAAMRPTEHRAYASGMYGNGRISGIEQTGKKEMGWAFEVRFGTEIDLPGSRDGKLFSSDEKYRVDIIHYNEGHPDNNHRDGFALQGIYNKPLSEKFSAELGFGPYYTMNTTSRRGVEYNWSNLGVLASAAILMDIDELVSGMHLRVGLNHVTMPGAHSSNALLVGVGKHFGAPARSAQQFSDADPLWLGATFMHGQTNHGGTQTSAGFSLEAKKQYRQWATSVSVMAEGDDDTRVNRHGVALQGWFVQPLTEKWTVSAGFGPYVAINTRGLNEYRVLALFSMQLDRSIGKDWRVFANFNRVNTFRDKNDRDLLKVGFMRAFDL